MSDLQQVQPFVQAMLNVLGTMCQTCPTVGEATLKLDSLTEGNITGVIRLHSHNQHGALAISFETSACLEVVSRLLMEKFTEINQDVRDAVGEITNMVCGGAKKIISESGQSFEMTLPTLLEGPGLDIPDISALPLTSVSFDLDAGKICMIVGLPRE